MNKKVYRDRRRITDPPPFPAHCKHVFTQDAEVRAVGTVYSSPTDVAFLAGARAFRVMLCSG